MSKSGRIKSFFLAAVGALFLASAPAHAQVPDADAGFAHWLGTIRTQALAEGVSPETLEATLSGLSFNPRVVALDGAQPDDNAVRTPTLFSDYLSKRLNNLRIARGRQLRSDLAATLSSIETRYGVPPSIILGIWGMETSYGGYSGDFDLIRSLASLAYDGRRRELFTRELIAALKIIDSGLISRERLVGSYAGATGQAQFLPTSYLSYAVDHDGDGRPDIWSSQSDVLASIANYLSRNGWRRGQSWGVRVIVPAGLDRGRLRDLVRPKSCPGVLSKHSRWIPIREWRALGLIPMGGGPWPADDVLATLVEPDGPGNGGYLTYGNFRAILEYNCSNFYALSVGLLADAIG